MNRFRTQSIFTFVALFTLIASADRTVFSQDKAVSDAEVRSKKNVQIRISAEARNSIERGLRYLAQQQKNNGSIGSGQYSGNAAVTAIAGMAFLASGSTPTEGPYSDNITAAMEYLLKNASPSGYLAIESATGHGPMYDHGFATLFIAEVHGMTDNGEVREKLKKAIDLIVRSQNSEGGWRYHPDNTIEHADLSVTICQIMALRAARNSGIAVPKKTIDKCVEYVRKSQNADGGFRYMLTPGGTEFPRSAAGVVALYSAGVYEGAEIKNGIAYIHRYLPGRPLRKKQPFLLRTLLRGASDVSSGQRRLAKMVSGYFQRVGENAKDGRGKLVEPILFRIRNGHVAGYLTNTRQLPAHFPKVTSLHADIFDRPYRTVTRSTIYMPSDRTTFPWSQSTFALLFAIVSVLAYFPAALAAQEKQSQEGAVKEELQETANEPKKLIVQPPAGTLCKIDGTKIAFSEFVVQTDWDVEGISEGKSISVPARQILWINFNNNAGDPAIEGPRIWLTSNRTLPAEPESLGDDELAVRSKLFGPLLLDVSSVKGFWLTDRRIDYLDEANLLEGWSKRTELSDLFLLNNNDEISALLMNLDESTIEFERNAKLSNLNRDVCKAIGMDPSLLIEPKYESIYAKALFSDGSRLNLQSIEMNGGFYKSSIDENVPIEGSTESIVRLEYRNTDAVFVSTLQATEKKQIAFLENTRPYRADRSAIGAPLQLKNRRYSSGLGCQSYCELQFRTEDFTAFHASIGIGRRRFIDRQRSL